MAGKLVRRDMDLPDNHICMPTFKGKRGDVYRCGCGKLWEKRFSGWEDGASWQPARAGTRWKYRNQ